MKIQLTNTLTRRKEPFVPADPKRVTMYVCGPTVYSYAHIGNARPPVVFDVLFRLLRRQYGDNAVIYARNYTDIDDKIIAAAAKSGEPMDAITKKFERIYEEDMSALGVLAPTLRPRATDNVAAMIALIEKLIANGAAYKVATGVYFSVAADDDYGKLSRRSQDDVKAGARVEGEDDKRHPSDFALWKTSKPGEPSWDAPFGAGRPGWHIECSAMIEQEMGSPIDIHGGGIDLIFPHHENEIAQSESAHGHPLARVWMHNGFLTMDATKMSKSLGNIITPRELLEQGWQGETIRWALLSAHYKAPLDWSDDLLRQAQASLDRLYQLLLDVGPMVETLAPSKGAEAHQHAEGAKLAERFIDELSDDLNTAAAISALFGIADELRSRRNAIVHGNDVGMDYLGAAYRGLQLAASLFGVLQLNPQDWFQGEALADDIQALIDQRIAARREKDWTEADRLRARLDQLGIEVMDNATGSTWRRKG